MRRWLLTIAEAFGFVLVLSCLGWWFVVQRLPHSGFEARAAAFGDVAGAVFSAFAFAGLIVTALMQREELSLQRAELRDTRAELKRTADAQEASEKALRAQVMTSDLTARLNAATALLEHYRSITPPPFPAIGDEEARMERQAFIETRDRNIKDVLDEIITLRDELRDVAALEVSVTASIESSLTASAVQQAQKGEG